MRLMFHGTSATNKDAILSDGLLGIDVLGDSGVVGLQMRPKPLVFLSRTEEFAGFYASVRADHAGRGLVVTVDVTGLDATHVPQHCEWRSPAPIPVSRIVECRELHFAPPASGEPDLATTEAMLAKRAMVLEACYRRDLARGRTLLDEVQDFPSSALMLATIGLVRLSDSGITA